MQKRCLRTRAWRRCTEQWCVWCVVRCRPGTAGLSLAPRSTLASRLSYLNRLAPDSPRTILSETDSMCSEISPAEVLRHNFFGTLSTRITSAGPSQHGSPRHPAGALAAVPSGTVLTGAAMQIASGLWDGMSPRNNAGHVPSPFQRAEAGPGSIPGSPLARAVSEALTRLSGRASALGDSRRHWDLVFSSEQVRQHTHTHTHAHTHRPTQRHRFVLSTVTTGRAAVLWCFGNVL